MLLSVLALGALVSQSSAARPSDSLRGLQLAPSGALARLPRAGVASVDGPAARLFPGQGEWFGVSFTDGAGLHEGVGCGARADWAGRAEVRGSAVRRGFGWELARAELGPLGIETLIEREGELAIVTVTLRNRGEEPLGQLFYSREWQASGGAGWTFPPDLPVRPAPAELARRLWMLDDLMPGAETGLAFALRLGPPRADLGSNPGSSLGPVEVPLSLYTDALWPSGVGLGQTNGLSFGDFDGDGWIDMFSLMSARLLRNVDGTTWQLAADLDSVLPFSSNRYGSSFGDYDNDGLPDIGTEPRTSSGDSCMHMLHNLGDALFEDIALDPLLFEGQPCGAPAETICWGDVDDDGDLDCFLPVYPRNLGPGNFFMENLGPSGPSGAYRFRENSAQAGLDNPPMTARPEGAQFVDVDGDGDMDLYSNGTLYRNESEGSVHFVPMTETGAGIGLREALDEGAAFFDYDLDGDEDLFIVYSQRGTRIWESRGDGTFFQAGGLIDDPRTGLDLGLSAEDWDMDGDIDFTTRQVFRRNRLVEDGERHFTVATHAIPGNHLTSATPAWGDWDKDGDLDCALGNWQTTGHFYENTLWSAGLPADQKPYLRVRVVRDDPAVPRGLEVEYAARVELRLHGDSFRRQKFVASGHGYLNQNEYALHFALPPGKNPNVPVEGLVCDVVVDFPGRASRGVLRIDRNVNPALGDVTVAALADREITVFRSGRVVIDGVVHEPASDLGRHLFALGGGLAQPDVELGLPDPVTSMDGNWVGIEFSTPATRRVRLAELVLDGHLTSAGSTFNLALWDVTDAEHPQLAHDALEVTSERNRRSAFPFEVELRPGHVYRCVAHVVEARRLPISGARQRHGVVLKGGIDVIDRHPENGKIVANAGLLPESALTLRYALETTVRQR